MTEAEERIRNDLAAQIKEPVRDLRPIPEGHSGFSYWVELEGRGTRTGFFGIIMLFVLIVGRLLLTLVENRQLVQRDPATPRMLLLAMMPMPRSTWWLGLSAARIRLAIASVPPRGASVHQHRVETDHVTVSSDAGNLRTGTSTIPAQ